MRISLLLSAYIVMLSLSACTNPERGVSVLPAIPTEGMTRDHAEWKAWLVQAGDLPSFHKAGENILMTDTIAMRNFPGAQLHVTQYIDNIERSGEMGGGVEFILYDTAANAAGDYPRLVGDLPLMQPSTVGEQSSLDAHSDRNSVIFLRCRAIVTVHGIYQLAPGKPRGLFDKNVVMSYATRLDQRLKFAVC